MPPEMVMAVAGALPAIACGYLTALVLHFILSYLIALEGRRFLLTGCRLNNAYHAQLGLSWVLTAAVSGMVTIHIVPDAPVAGISVLCVAILICTVLVRTWKKSQHQHSNFETARLVLCVCLGSALPAYLGFVPTNL